MRLPSVGSFTLPQYPVNHKKQPSPVKLAKLADGVHFSGATPPSEALPADPVKAELTKRVSAVEDFITRDERKPLHSVFSLRELSRTLNQPDSVSAVAIAKLFENGRIMPSQGGSWHDIRWTVIQKDERRGDGQYHTVSLFSNPAFRRLRNDFLNIANFKFRDDAENLLEGRTTHALSLSQTALMNAMPYAPKGIYRYGSPKASFILDYLTEPDINRATISSKMDQIGTLIEEAVHALDTKGQAEFIARPPALEPGTVGPVIANTKGFQRYLDDNSVTSGGQESIHNFPLKDTVSLYKEYEHKIISRILAKATPGQPIITGNVLARHVCQVLDSDNRFATNRTKYYEAIKLMFDKTPSVATIQRLNDLQNECREDIFYNVSGMGIQREMFDLASRVATTAMACLIVHGYLDEDYRFTDKVLAYQKTEPVVQRFNEAGEAKKLTFYLEEPTEGHPDKWTLAYCWTLPKLKGESEPPRLGIPRYSYDFPSTSLDIDKFNAETHAALGKALAEAPGLTKVELYPNIPPQPVLLNEDEVQSFIDNAGAKLQETGEFNILVPTGFLKKHSITGFGVRQGVMDGLVDTAGSSEGSASPLLKSGSWEECRTPGQLRKFSEALQDERELRKPVTERSDANATEYLNALLYSLNRLDAERTDLQIQAKEPDGLQAKLFPFQLEGYSFMKHNADTKTLGGAILADDMGLGKTVQTLAVLQDRFNRQKAGSLAKHPTLIICPSNVIPEWQSHIDKFTAAEFDEEGRQLTPIPSGMLSSRNVGDIRPHDAGIILASYQMVQTILGNNPKALTELPWDGIILDEAHHIKGGKNPWAKAALTLAPNAEYRVALTGTPLHNHVGDMWALGKFVAPATFPNRVAYRKQYIDPLSNPSERGVTLNALKDRFKPYMLRRTKMMPHILEQIGGNIGDIHHHRIYTPLNETQVRYSNAIYDEIKRHREGGQRKATGAKFSVMSQITPLRQIALHPDLYQAAVPASGEAVAVNTYAASSPTFAMMELARILKQKVLPKHQQMIVFTPYKAFNTVLGDYLQKQDPDPEDKMLIYDGNHKTSNRYNPVELFKKDEGHHYPVLIMTNEIGGEGLNLQNANHVALFSPKGNPQVEDQAINRAWRIRANAEGGKPADVEVYHFTAFAKNGNRKPARNDIQWKTENPFTDFSKLKHPDSPTIEINIANSMRNKRQLIHDVLNNNDMAVPDRQPEDLLRISFSDDLERVRRRKRKHKK